MLGRHDSMPARIAMATPILKVLDRVATDLPSEGVPREPPMEHRTIPKITSAVPARRTRLLVVRRRLRKEQPAAESARPGWR